MFCSWSAFPSVNSSTETTISVGGPSNPTFEVDINGTRGDFVQAFLDYGFGSVSPFVPGTFDTSSTGGVLRLALSERPVGLEDINLEVFDGNSEFDIIPAQFDSTTILFDFAQLENGDPRAVATMILDANLC